MRNTPDVINEIVALVPERFQNRDDLIEELSTLALQYKDASEATKTELTSELKQTLDFYIGAAVAGHGGWKQKIYALLD